MTRDHRIAILHPHGGMGDLLLSYPVIAAFKQAYPESEIIYITPPGLEDVIRANSNVHEVFSLKLGHKAAFNLAKYLKKKNVEIACALWSTFRIALILKLAAIPIRIGQGDRFLYSHWFTHPVSVRSTKGDTGSHWVECLLDYPRALGLNPSDKSIHVKIEDTFKLGTNNNLNVSSSFPRPYIVIHSGKGENVLERGWPLDYFAELADRLTQRGFQIVFTGSNREIKLVENILAKMKTKAISMAGKTDFQQLASLLKSAHCIVCPDSGPMHLAAAVGTPVVALFAMKSDFPNRWAPWGVPHKIIRPKTFPCSDQCTKESCRNFLCFQALNIDETERAVLDLIKTAVQS